MLDPPVFLPPGHALVRVEGEDSLGEVGAGGVVAMALLNTVLMLATLATLGRSASFIQLSSHLLFYTMFLAADSSSICPNVVCLLSVCHQVEKCLLNAC